MLKNSFLALTVAASFATPAFSQTAERCVEGAVFSVTNAECGRFDGEIVGNQCVLSDAELANARDELCLALPDSTNVSGDLSGVGIAAGAGLLLAVAAGGSSNTTTTTTTN